MPKFTLSKTIEARKLNERTRIPTTGPPVTIPYGAIIANVEQDRDVDNFTYLGEWYQCRHELLQEVLQKTGVGAAAKPAEAQAAPRPGVAEPAPEAAEAKLKWEAIPSDYGEVRRAKVPGGWLVAAGGGVTFLPDPGHEW